MAPSAPLSAAVGTTPSRQGTDTRTGTRTGTGGVVVAVFAEVVLAVVEWQLW